MSFFHHWKIKRVIIYVQISDIDFLPILVQTDSIHKTDQF